MSAAPRLDGWSRLPSILVGRPSWLSTTTPLPKPIQGQVEAKNSGRPGITSSGGTT